MPNPTITCFCCSDARSSANIVNHIMTHKEALKDVIDRNSATNYSVLQREPRDPLYVCFGCKKCWSSSTAARRHYKEGEDCLTKHNAFLKEIGIVRESDPSHKYLLRIKELEKQLEDTQLELSINKRIGKTQDLLNEIRDFSEWMQLLNPMFDFIQDRLTEQERKNITAFWRVEHNPMQLILSHEKMSRSDVLKLLKQNILQDPILQLMLIPTFQSYRESKLAGKAANLQSLISGQALYNLHFIPDRYGKQRLLLDEDENES